ncbi:phage GP46 family protein [Thiohalophilus sp.]|uniref:phage GP46 family protein n=1 Tax=Thiohalophilus sp. TaxID=3028392 RepID=UPI002ACEAE8C|nr:phage GP46 family protein [Thiohalophilus sp.]MDZ7804345.1 phage GP46 family protein [Thiohalophilus sp.]
MDIVLTQSGDLQFDARLSGPELATDDGLRTAVMLSLFTDARATEDDPLPNGARDRRGCWMDSFLDNDSIGSRLWLLSREKETPDVLQRARQYAEEALQWLLDDGVAESISVSAERVRAGVLGIYTTINLVDGTDFTDVFETEL